MKLSELNKLDTNHLIQIAQLIDNSIDWKISLDDTFKGVYLLDDTSNPMNRVSISFQMDIVGVGRGQFVNEKKEGDRWLKIDIPTETFLKILDMIKSI